MQTADQISASEFELIILKDQYEKVTDTRVPTQSREIAPKDKLDHTCILLKRIPIQSYLCN